jgi:hypothetical protein
MRGQHIRLSLVGGLLLLLTALGTLFALLFLAARSAIHLNGVCVLSGFALIQIGFGGALCERGMQRHYFPDRRLPLYCVVGGCTSMLAGILSG